MSQPLPRKDLANPFAAFGVHARKPARDDDGFTLIELLIVMVILPFIIGALSLAIVAVLSLQGSETNRVSNAADAQVVSTSFENDVHSSLQLTTTSTPSCGPSGYHQVLGAEWGLSSSGTYESVVSYDVVQSGSAYQLAREFCPSGPSASATSATTVSYNVPSTLAGPTVTQNQNDSTGTCANAPSALASGWISSECVATVVFPITEPGASGNSYSYSLTASPANNSSSSPSSTLDSGGSGCGFAEPGTGTYASSLCFVDFEGLIPADVVNSSTNCPTSAGGQPGGQYMTSPISGTSYTISFCLAVTPSTDNYSSAYPSSCVESPNWSSSPYWGAVCAASTPTYANPPTSEAYLGDSGFYMDIPGDPALYTTQNGGYASVDLFFTNIKVADSSGNLATGWYLVTGDAESTDNYEDSIWSTCSAITDTKTDDGKTTPAVPAPCTSSTDLTLLPDTYNGVNATAEIGNVCTYTAANVPAATAFPGTWLTGVGTNTVECAASVSVDKSGTVMLEAPTPSTLTVQMNPQGLQAIFLGVLLP